ncbi:TPA: hypothetical protein ACHG1G_003542 [Escherichia coli]|nr:hypothetical protein [Escherichia coli]
MSNSFDFELVADDKVSGAIERINESLNDLQPKLDKTRTGLQFGGQETLDGLNRYNSRLELMAQSARDNVLQVRAFCSQFRMGAVVKVRSLITWLVRLKRQCLIRR